MRSRLSCVTPQNQAAGYLARHETSGCQADSRAAWRAEGGRLMMQVEVQVQMQIQMQKQKHIASCLICSRPVEDCPPLFLIPPCGRETAEAPKTGALPGDGALLLSSSSLVMMEKQWSPPRFGRPPEFVFCDSSAGTDSTGFRWIDEPLTMESGQLTIDNGSYAMYHVPCRVDYIT